MSSALFSSTEIELMKQVDKDVKKVGLKDTQRIVLFFTPALRINEGILLKDINTSDTDLGDRLRWVVGHIYRESLPSGDAQIKDKLPLGWPANTLSSGAWLTRLGKIQLAMPDARPSLEVLPCELKNIRYHLSK